MSRANLSSQSCSIARAVALVGDQWTIMIMREMFLATRRFDDFLNLTGMSSHLLSQRLKKLETLGVIRRQAYSQRPPRYEYRLTQMGRDLWPVIIAFKQWGDRWLTDDEPSVQLIHKGCDAASTPRLMCSQCGEPMEAHDAVAQLAPAFEQERSKLRKQS
ncbi:MAG: helix-turn-helix domain-containing protein [Rhizobiaceae bacterium]